MTPFLDITGVTYVAGCGYHTAAGEEWVSPGVGERMIAYMQRRYGGQKPAGQRKSRVHLHLTSKAKAKPPKPTVLAACVDCGVEIVKREERHLRCHACHMQRKRDLAKAAYYRNAAGAAQGLPPKHVEG